MPSYWDFRISAWQQIAFITSYTPVKFLETDVFEDKYQLFQRYFFGERVPWHTGHRKNEMYIRKNYFVAFFILMEANFRRKFDPQNGDGDFFSYNVSGIVNLPNSILLSNTL